MVNSQVVAETIDAFKLDMNVDKIPQPIPVIEVGMKLASTGFARRTHSVTTGSMTLSATSLNSVSSDYYIDAISVDIVKDATCDIATGEITVTVTPVGIGLSTTIISIPVLTLTAQNHNNVYIFKHPIKCLRNTGVSMSGTYTAGLMARSMVVSGYRDLIV